MNDCIKQIKNFLETKNSNSTFFVRTYGCQMNVRDSEKLSGMLMLMGYTRAKNEREADLIIYNTCCVRENAENKIFGNLGYLKYQKETNRSLTIVLCGCMVQQPHIRKQIETLHPYVDVVFGTYNRLRFPEMLWQHIKTGRQIIDIDENNPPVCESESDRNYLTHRGHPHKAGVNVMYGCDNFCAYCIVPYVRGRERSRSLDDVLYETNALVQDGVKEIMLLGQNVNAYGMGIKTNFAELIKRVNDIPGLERIRFMTSHPKDMDDALIYAMRDCEKVCKSIHLPLQSGSSRILKEMNRNYTKEKYLDLIYKIKENIPGIAVSTDLMVGHPGETEEDFEHSLEVVRKVNFSGVFTFIYSPRTGTASASRADTIPEAVAAVRFKRLTELINPMLLTRNENMIGKIINVMMEEDKSGKNNTQKGRADDNTLVHVSGGDYKPGEIVAVKVVEAKTFYVSGIVEK